VTPVRKAIEAHLGTPQVARVIYGAIIGMALVVVLQDHPPSDARVVAALVATALAVALAELYADVVGTETRTRRHIVGDQVREMAGEAGAVAFGVVFPAVFFVLAAAGAMETETAFTVAKWSGIGLIGFYGFCAGRLSGEGVPASLLQGVGACAIGAILIGFKAVVH
jgi:VIT1/CCC1 family predicted Fe2+/Mn2+ transporter